MCANTTKNFKSLFICQLFPNLSMNFIPLLRVMLYSLKPLQLSLKTIGNIEC